MRMRILHVLPKASRVSARLAVLLAALCAACTSVEIYQPELLVRGYTTDRDGLAARNQQKLKKTIETSPDPKAKWNREAPDNRPFSAEWSFNRAGQDAPPATCLSLSGGGVRSAAFSIGVMAALHERGVLHQLDAMSAVSGGSYALSWLYAQQFHRRKDHDELMAKQPAGSAAGREAARRVSEDLFRFDGKYQEFLRDNFSLFKTADYYTLAAVDVVPMALFNFFANVVFSWHSNTTFSRPMYESRLRATFHSPPDGAAAGDIALGELGAFAQGKLPFFLINATALIEDDEYRHASRLANSIFEFGPRQFGSDAYGRFLYSRDPSLSLSLAVSISGAALDSATLVAGPAKKVFWSLLNQDMGFYMHNPGIRAEDRNWEMLKIFPFYFFSKHNVRDINGSHIYLTDGGHSENLGLFPLLRRGCRSVIVVDAEEDPAYTFSAYRDLKKALDREMHVEFTVDEIDRSLRESTQCPDRKAADCVSLGAGAGKAPKDYTDGIEWKKFARTPVMDGKVCCLPYPGPEDSVPIPVKYIKLAFHAEETPPLGRSGCLAEFDTGLRKYFRDRQHATFSFGIGRKAASFPQDPTANQDFSPEQFMRYRDLGYALTMSHDRPLPGEAEWSGPADAKQCPGAPKAG